MPSVRVDGTSAIHELIRHLRDLGHRRIAFISGPGLLSTGRERAQAYEDAMRANGLEIRDEYMEAERLPSGERPGHRRALPRPARAT